MWKQDQGLDYIAEGLDTLKNMAEDINEVHLYRYILLMLCFFGSCRSDSLTATYTLQELDRQEPLMDEIDTKVN